MKGSVISLAAIMGVLGSAQADVIFSFDYSGSAEFMDPTLGAARRAALEDASAKLGRVFDHTAVVTIEVQSEVAPGSGTLAAAYSDYGGVSGSGYVQGVVMKKIRTGIDDNGGAADGVVIVNFGESWDLDDEVGLSDFDFKATMIHELLHTMGFLSGIAEDGSDFWGSPLGDPGIWDVFDDYLSDKNGVQLINDGTFVLNVASWDSLKTGGASPAGGLFFNGPKAMAANGGQPVGLYSPGVWEEGSSGSHLDDQNPAQEGLLMLAATGTGRYRRSLGDLERGILEDIGFQLQPLAVPGVEVVSVTPGVEVVLQLSGPECRWYVVEKSATLPFGWSEVEVVEMPLAGMMVTVPIGAADDELYFRLRETGVPSSPTALSGERRWGWR